MNLLRPLCDRLRAKGQAELHVIDAADHSFHVPKKSGRTDEDVLEELGEVVADWTSNLGSNA